MKKQYIQPAIQAIELGQQIIQTSDVENGGSNKGTIYHEAQSEEIEWEEDE